MKDTTSRLWKRIVSMLTSIAKANSIVVKNKTTSLKTRFLMSSLLRSKKALTGSISNKIHSLLGHHQDRDQGENAAADYEYNGDHCKDLVLYNATVNNESESDQVDPNCIDLVKEYEDDGREKYPDLRHELEEYDDNAGSIIDLVRNSKEDHGERFSLEDEIDHVADLFITRFHKQMRLQKLLSFKRFQERVERNAS